MKCGGTEMQVHTLQLWEDQEHVTLTAYLPAILTEGQALTANRPAIIICPGGAYLYTSQREAEPVALRFASLGYQTFVLHYNTYYGQGPIDLTSPPPANPFVKFPQPIFDIAKAIVTVREHAQEWNVNADQITVAGFSAGGHLAASIGVHWQDEFVREKLGVDAEKIRPDALILGYALLDSKLSMESMNEAESAKYNDMLTLMNSAVFGATEYSEQMLEQFSPALHIRENTPPAFIWHTAEDDLVRSSNSLKFALGLASKRIPYELHVFEKGEHGLSLADLTSATTPQHVNHDVSEWVKMADRFLKRRFSI